MAILRIQGEQYRHSSPCIETCRSMGAIRCGVLFICIRATPNAYCQINERLHAFFCYDGYCSESAVRIQKDFIMLTLHEAIAVVLREGAKTPRELADEINRRNLYRRKDGRPLPANQVSARIRAYGYLFVKKGKMIFLKRAL